MATDTTYITTAATHFEGYARDLREHARTLALADGVRWASDSAEAFRRSLAPVVGHRNGLAGAAEQAARSLRAHATAVENSAAAAVVSEATDAGLQVVTAVAAPVLSAVEALW